MGGPRLARAERPRDRAAGAAELEAQLAREHVGQLERQAERRLTDAVDEALV